MKKYLLFIILTLIILFSSQSCSKEQEKGVKNCSALILDKKGKPKVVDIACCPSIDPLTIFKKSRSEVEKLLGKPYVLKNRKEQKGQGIYYQNGGLGIIYDTDEFVNYIVIYPDKLPLDQNAILDFLQINQENFSVTEGGGVIIIEVPEKFNITATKDKSKQFIYQIIIK